MTDQSTVIAVITAAWLFVLALVALARIVRGNGHATLFLTCVHFAFFGIPLVLDVLYGPPEVPYQGFADALRSQPTTIAFCLTVAIAPLLWQWAGGAGTWIARSVPAASTSIGRGRLALMCSPFVLAMGLVGPSPYLNYGSVGVELLEEQLLSAHSFVSIATLLAIAAIATATARIRAFTAAQAFVLGVGTVTAVWLNGKRAILVIAALWIGYALWRRRRAASIPLVTTTVASAVILAVTLVSYQWLVRGVKVGDRGAYLNARIDFGRDLVLKQTLLAEVTSGQEPILEYRGQSFLFYATLPIPRESWPEKPWPYAIYQTSRMLGIPNASIGWGTTTSWLDETIANCGLLGVLIGPLSLGLLCRIGHAANDRAVDATTTVVAVLFLTLQLAAFYPLMLVWLFQRISADGSSLRWIPKRSQLVAVRLSTRRSSQSV